MKLNLVLLFLATVTINSIFANNEPLKEAELICHVKACGDELWLFEFDGTTFQPIYQAKKKSDSLFFFKFPESQPKFYYVGNDRDHVKPIILGNEAKVVIKGSCSRRAFNLTILESKVNNYYNELKKQMNGLRLTHSTLAREYRSSRKDDEKEKIVEKMASLDEDKLAFLDSVQAVDPLFGSIVAVNTYLTFQNIEEGKYPNEVYYFADKFFQFADFSNEAYNRSSWLYEAFKGYTTTISSVNMDKERHLGYLNRLFDKIPAETKARKLALSSTIVILKQKNHPNFIPVAERFIEEFYDSDRAAAVDLQKQISVITAFMEGGQAPDFTQNSDKGESIKLSDFRGKVLLVDFWASWCGPCRRENPHVVKLYNKYKEKGFEILGVSLDSKKDRWLTAIEQDKMSWYHVSDLKGWSNEAAKLYNVTSIPHTILLDKEGKIIARNLRGSSLANKLAEIFEIGDE